MKKKKYLKQLYLVREMVEFKKMDWILNLYLDKYVKENNLQIIYKINII